MRRVLAQNERRENSAADWSNTEKWKYREEGFLDMFVSYYWAQSKYSNGFIAFGY